MLQVANVILQLNISINRSINFYLNYNQRLSKALFLIQEKPTELTYPVLVCLCCVAKLVQFLCTQLTIHPPSHFTGIFQLNVPLGAPRLVAPLVVISRRSRRLQCVF